MPDLTVIDGDGKPRDHRRAMAGAAFRRTVIEMLRALARGEDNAGKVFDQLALFTQYLKGAKDDRADTLISEVLTEMHADTEREMHAERHDFRHSVVLRALRVAAETAAEDEAARGRASRRIAELENSMQAWALDNNYLRQKIVDMHSKPRKSRKKPDDDIVL